ncbi:MAG: VWA domain-containing protein [Planctomycetota bacterium]
MNNDENRNEPFFHVTEQELLDARITAQALGELDAAERTEIERLLADPMNREPRMQVAEVQRVAAALKADRDDAGLTRSADLRRTVLAAAAAPLKRVAPAPRPAGSRWLWRGITALGSLAALLLVAVTMLSSTALVRRDHREQSTEQSALARSERSVPFRGLAPSENADSQRRSRGDGPAGVPMPQAKAASTASAVESAAADLAAAAPAPAAGVANGISAPAPAFFAERPAANGARRQLPGMASPAFDHEVPRSREGYASVTENQVVSPREQPLSTFSIDVDTASYANVRRFLSAGRLPPRDAVRIEELVNYFHYDYPLPDGDKPFSVTVEAAACPWNAGRRLVRIGLQGRDIDRGARPAGNLVFLVDVSGSMNSPTKLPLVKQALAMLVEELSENDRVAIVTYAGNAGLVLPSTTGDQKETILAAIESLTPGGSTHGSAGINLAYEQAREHFVGGGSNRVILATDGDLNVGVTSSQALIDLIKQKAGGGTFLTVLGFGEGNLQDDKMEALADNGNGVYAYIDGVREARKVLVEQLTGSTITIAKDVKIQVEFNPAQVASYRLLGYENRRLAARDFRDDKKDAGEIGAGHSVTALYEITLVGEETSAGAEPLKYQRQQAEPVAAIDANASGELLTVKLRSKRPDGDTSVLEEVPLADRGGSFAQASDDLRFASAVAAFGMILRGSDQRGDATLPLVAKIAAGSLGRDESGYRAEFLDLVRKAESAK